MSDLQHQMRGLQYSPDVDAMAYVKDDAFTTNVDAIHGADGGVAVLTAHPNFFSGLNAEEDGDGDEVDESPNDVLLRLLNEVRAVDSDVDEDATGALDRCSDDNAAGAPFSVTDNSGAKGYAVAYGGAAAVNGGFTVEGNTSYSSAASLHPPPPPPPAYGTPSTAPRSPFLNCYSGIPHLAATPGSTKPPPPTFAEAISTAHGTPASLPGGRLSTASQERSPVMANYVPPMPAALQEPVLLRNCNGVFLLQPVSKPTPPYTPPAGCNSPPVSPLPRYSLPPAAAMGGPSSSTTSNNFLGSSMAQTVGPRPATVVEPPHYATYGAAGGSPFITTAIPYVSAVSSVRGTPSFGAAPPPYTGGR